MRWDPAQYARFSDERSRPFFDLVGQIGAVATRAGGGPGLRSGELTATLAARWPAATVRGLDSSAEMIERAAVAGDRLSFALADAADFDAGGVDVLVSNALLQWVPGHQELLVRWAGQLARRWLAGLSGAGQLRLAVAPADARAGGLGPVAARLAGVLRHADAVAEPAEYLELLTGAGLRVNAWQTSYLHVLSGPDPVLEWVRGTGLRPVLAALDADEAAEFVAEYAGAAAAGLPGAAVRHGVSVPAYLRGRPQARHSRLRMREEARMILGLDHVQVAIPAGGEDAARAFYGSLLGMAEVAKPAALAVRGGCWFTAGSAVLHLGVEEPFHPGAQSTSGLAGHRAGRAVRLADRRRVRVRAGRRRDPGGPAVPHLRPVRQPDRVPAGLARGGQTLRILDRA